MTVLMAHAGHWLLGLGYAGAPLIVIAGIAVIALRERHRDGDAA